MSWMQERGWRDAHGRQAAAGDRVRSLLVAAERVMSHVMQLSERAVELQRRDELLREE